MNKDAPPRNYTGQPDRNRATDGGNSWSCNVRYVFQHRFSDRWPSAVDDLWHCEGINMLLQPMTGLHARLGKNQLTNWLAIYFSQKTESIWSMKTDLKPPPLAEGRSRHSSSVVHRSLKQAVCKQDALCTLLLRGWYKVPISFLWQSYSWSVFASFKVPFHNLGRLS